MNIQITSPADDQLTKQLTTLNNELTTMIASGNTSPSMLQRIASVSKLIQERASARLHLHNALEAERRVNESFEKLTHPREGVRSVQDLTDFSQHEQEPAKDKEADTKDA